MSYQKYKLEIIKKSNNGIYFQNFRKNWSIKIIVNI